MYAVHFIWHQIGTSQKMSFVHFNAISLITGCQEWLFEMIIIATWSFLCVIIAENIGIHGKCSLLLSQHSYCYAAADSIPVTKNIHTSLDACCPRLPIYSKLSLESKSHPWDNTGIIDVLIQPLEWEHFLPYMTSSKRGLSLSAHIIVMTAHLWLVPT
jgi:hypothetical protein